MATNDVLMSIPGCETFINVEPITKGWMPYEKKYYIETSDGRRLLLRIADVSKYETQRALYTTLERIAELAIPMPRPVNFGFCDNNQSVYLLQTWVDGEDVESALPTLSETEQYCIGLKAGRLLKKIHSIPAPKGTEDWNINFDRMLHGEIESYNAKTELHSEQGDMIINFLRSNRKSLGVRPQTLLHGDYNPGNMIIMPSGELGAIDFGESSYGDPCWDIFKIGWRPNLFPYFYSGQIRGHFDGEPTLEFWNAYSYYFAFGALIALQSPEWAGFNNPEEGKSIMQNIFAWSDNINNPIPAWYVNDIN